MSEYIVDGRNIVIARQSRTPHLTEIVRCRDCKFADWDITAWWCTRDKHYLFEIGELRGYGERSHLDGFCAWGERRIVCKCGEELESEGVCPACGRSVLQDG